MVSRTNQERGLRSGLENVLGNSFRKRLITCLSDTIHSITSCPINEQRRAALVLVGPIQQDGAVRSSEQPCPCLNPQGVFAFPGFDGFKPELFHRKFEHGAHGDLARRRGRYGRSRDQQAGCFLSGGVSYFFPQGRRAGTGPHGFPQIKFRLGQLVWWNSLLAGSDRAICGSERSQGDLKHPNHGFKLRMPKMGRVQHAPRGHRGAFTGIFHSVIGRIAADHGCLRTRNDHDRTRIELRQSDFTRRPAEPLRWSLRGAGSEKRDHAQPPQDVMNHNQNAMRTTHPAEDGYGFQRYSQFLTTAAHHRCNFALALVN